MNQQQQQHHHHDDAEESDQIANCARVCPIKMREKFFRHHAGGVVRLNHGSFGACPQPVMDATAEARAQWYQQPDAFYFEQLESQILENRKAVAEVVNCDVRDLALVDNATTGSLVVAHLVAKDLQRRLLSDPVHYVKPKILLSNFVYGAVKNVFIEHLGDLAEIEYINFPFPLQSRAHALEALQQALLSSSSSSTTTTTTTTTTNTNGSPLSSNGSPYSLGSSGETPQVPSMGDGEWETHTPSNFVPSSPFNPFQNQNQSPFSSSDGFTVPSPNLFDHSPSPSFTAVSPSPSFISSPSPLQQQTFFPTSHFQQQQQQQHFHFQQQQVQQVVQQQQVQKRQPIRLVVLDHISSIPAIIFPVQEMVKLCYSCGVEEVFIDGAHAIGQTPIDLMAIGADYYTSNLHKWLFCASGVALFFCHPRKRGNQSPPLMADELGSEPIDFASSNNFGQPHHPLTSHNYHRGMGAEFAWTGTHDYSPFLSVRNAIHFINSTLGGVDNLLSYNHHVVYSAASVVAKAWGTSFGTGEEELVGSMINIRLPDALCAQIHSSADALKLRSLIRDYFRVECVPFYWREGESYIRLSAQIYNSFNDYEILRDSVLASIKLLSSMSQ